mmetsp:Transcript_72400/g.166092  ORF Transcript_72400/g.166092 Transcript_72400/m.166092 type:complete len:226 (-) Transcript_72400:2-679(-)
MHGSSQRSLHERPQQLVLLQIRVRDVLDLMQLQKPEPRRHSKHRPLLAPELIPDVSIFHLLRMGILKVGVDLQDPLGHLSAQVAELRVPWFTICRDKKRMVLHLIIQEVKAIRHILCRCGGLIVVHDIFRGGKSADATTACGAPCVRAIAYQLHRAPEKIALAMASDHCQSQPILLIRQARHLRPQQRSRPITVTDTLVDHPTVITSHGRRRRRGCTKARERPCT